METYKINLQLLADGGSVVNTTTGTANANTGATTTSNAMSSTMNTYYDRELLENARDEAIYGQLGKRQALPRNHGKTVEWRKWNTLPEPDKLVEGVIPEGKKFGQTSLNVAIAQYGEYVSVSDQLELHAIDDTILGATEEVGAAMGSGADAAIEAADVVFMKADLTSIPISVKIARKANIVSKENIVFALAVKILVMILGLFGIASMWLAVFADTGVAMLCVLNSIRMLYMKTE